MDVIYKKIIAMGPALPISPPQTPPPKFPASAPVKATSPPSMGSIGEEDEGYLETMPERNPRATLLPSPPADWVLPSPDDKNWPSNCVLAGTSSPKRHFLFDNKGEPTSHSSATRALVQNFSSLDLSVYSKNPEVFPAVYLVEEPVLGKSGGVAMEWLPNAITVPFGQIGGQHDVSQVARDKIKSMSLDALRTLHQRLEIISSWKCSVQDPQLIFSPDTGQAYLIDPGCVSPSTSKSFGKVTRPFANFMDVVLAELELKNR